MIGKAAFGLAGFAATLLASVAYSSPALAQFEIVYPEEPAKEGQTLLEWARPPILDHTIAEEERRDTSTCAAKFDGDLNQTAVACWPVLRAAQLYILAEYTAGEPTGDKTVNRRKGIEYADQAIAFIGNPEWPMQEYLLIKSLELKLNSLMRLDDWDTAYDTSVQLVSAIQGDLYEYDQFRLGFAYRKQGQVLLKLGLYKDAQSILEDARTLLVGFDAEKNALPFSDHSEDIIVHAINAGDITYAQNIARRYLDHVRNAPLGMEFGKDIHIDLLLYIAALRGDGDTALALLKERFADESDYARCDDGFFQFPRVLGPLMQNSDIRAAVLAGGCSAEQLSAPRDTPIKGLDGKTLPSFKRENAS